MCDTRAARLDAAITYAGQGDARALEYARAMGKALKRAPREASVKIGMPTLFAFGTSRQARRAYAETLEYHRQIVERRLEPVVMKVMEDLGDIAATAIREGGADHAAYEVARAEPMVAALYEVIYAEAIPYFAERVYDSAKSSRTPRETKETLDVWADRARRWVGLNAGVLIRGVTDTTVDLVRLIVEDGLREGWGMEKIGRELRKEWPEISQYRAVTIARTETITASSEGAQAAAEQLRDDSGLNIRKEWIATRDDRTRDAHRMMDREIVGLDDYFILDGEPALYPGDASLSPENRINCRCTHGFAAE